MPRSVMPPVAMLIGFLSLPVRAQTAPPMTFFVTSAGLGDGGNLGGLAGADAHCQKLVTAVGAGGKTWRAYLYSSGRRDAATYWPQYRKNDRTKIAGTSTTFGAVVKGKMSEMVQLDYTEEGVATTDRNGHMVETVYSFK